MTERELVIKYGSELVERYLDCFHENYSVSELIEIIIDLKEQTGELDTDMEELQKMIDDEGDEDDD